MMRFISSFAATLLFGGCVFAQANSSPPSAAVGAAASLPHDHHEGLTVSADPYTDPARAKAKFGKANPLPVGILPVEVFLRNETPEPIHVGLNAVQLVVRFAEGQHQDLDWLSAREVAGVVAHPSGASTPHAPRLPVGMSAGVDSKAEKLVDILEPLTLDADVVPPTATIHGFLFFDLGRNLSLAGNASLYLPEAAVWPSKRPLMFFEVFFGRASQP